jgi:hypothetical protein
MRNTIQKITLKDTFPEFDGGADFAALPDLEAGVLLFAVPAAFLPPPFCTATVL